jgi:hypothetical protein
MLVMEWLFSWEVVSVLVALLVSIGLGVLALEDFRLAKLFFLLAAADAIGGVAMWGAKAATPRWISTLAVICVSGAIGWLTLESIRYVDSKRAEKEAGAAVGVSGVVSEVQKLEFLQRRQDTIHEARFFVRLNRPHRPEELRHFRVLFEVVDHGRRNPDNPALWLSARDSYVVGRRGGTDTLLFGIKHIAWSRSPDARLQETMIGSGQANDFTSDEIQAWSTIGQRGPFQTIGSLDRVMASIFVTKPLLQHVVYVGFSVDDYLLLGFPISSLEPVERKPLVEWPEKLTPQEQKVEWAGLLSRRYWPNDQTRPPLRPPIMLDFGKYTPMRMSEFRSRQDWQLICVPSSDMAKLFPYSAF